VRSLLLAALTFFVVPTAFAEEHSQDINFCNLYPITVSEQLLSDAQAGEFYSEVLLGSGQGNYNWLSWRGENDVRAISESLQPPGNSSEYQNPYIPGDSVLSREDWVQGLPGVKNARPVREALDALLGNDIVIPLFKAQEQSGSNRNYQIGSYATVALTDYSLNGKGYLSFEFKGKKICNNKPPAIVSVPLDVTPEGEEYQYQVVVEDPNEDDIHTYSVNKGPLGLDLNSDTGRVSWLPGSEYVQTVPTFNSQCYVVQRGMAQSGADGDGSLSYIAPIFQRVKDALALGAQYTAEESLKWDKSHQCLGCHIQTQSLLGLETSQDKVSLDPGATEYLLDRLLSSQKSDGSIYDNNTTGLKVQTALALWSLTFHPDKTRTLEARANALGYLYQRKSQAQSSIYWLNDHGTGWLNNNVAMTALVAMSSARFVSDVKELGEEDTYSDLISEIQSAAEGIHEFYLSQSGSVGNDNLKPVFILTGLAEIQHLLDEELLLESQSKIDALDDLIRERQLEDGGWGKSSAALESDPLTSAWAGLALDYGSPSLDDPAVISNIEFLLGAQQADGTWWTNSGLFSTRLATTSLVMSYLPVAMDHLGNPDIRVGHVFLRGEPGSMSLVAELSNRGLAHLLVPVTVNFRLGSPDGHLLGQSILFGFQSGHSTEVEVAVLDGSVNDDVYVVLDVEPITDECHVSNNQTVAAYIDVTATDLGGLSDSQSWLLNVDDVNQSPVITSSPVEQHQAGQPYRYLVTVDDPDVGDDLKYSLIEGPDGVHIDAKTGLLTAAPGGGIPGDHTITIQVKDLRGGTDQQQYQLRIYPNQAPYFVSSPPLTGDGAGAYHYAAMAEDPNPEDQLRYVLESPRSSAKVDPETGVMSWSEEPDYVQPLLLTDHQCLSMPEEKGGDGSAAADVIIAMDESGSMSNEQAWITQAIHMVDAGLQGANVGVQIPNKYGVVGFSSSSRPRVIRSNGTNFVGIDEFHNLAKQLRTSGGVEDGWRAIKVGLDDLPVRDSLPKNIILVTDEDRDNTDSSVTYNSIKQQLEETGSILNAVVNARFYCEDGRPALGMDSQGNGYVQEQDGDYSICKSGNAASGSGKTVEHYVNLAMDNGGAAWDLSYLRRGGDYAKSFTKAFVEIKVKEVVDSIQPRPLPDLVPHDIEWVGPDQINAVVSNRGLATSIAGATVKVFHKHYWTGTELLWEEALPALGPGDAHPLSLSGITSEISDTIEVEVIAPESKECHVDNNLSRAGVFELSVYDQAGESDVQYFAAAQLQVNQKPQITSSAISSAVQGQAYSFVVEAQDPNPGDGLTFSLLSPPEGLSIDPLTGRVTANENVVPQQGLNYTVRVTDLSGLYQDQNHAVIVEAADNLPPVISPVPVLYVEVGELLGYQIEAVDPEGQTLDFGLSSAPDRLYLNGQTGYVEWLPSLGDVGVHNVRVYVVDSAGARDEQIFAIEVTDPNADNLPPVISSEPEGALYAGQTFSYQVLATDPDNDVLSYTLDGGHLDMAVSESGLFTWIPSARLVGETVSVTVVVEDGRGGQAQQTLNLPVSEASNHPPTITSEPQLTGSPGTSWLYFITATDEDGDAIEFRRINGPNGMNLIGDRLSWTPSSEQSGIVHDVEIHAIDARGAIAIQRFGIAVNTASASNSPPQITSKPEAQPAAGETWLYALKAADPDNDPLSYHLLSGPNGMLMDPSGVTTWTPASTDVGRQIAIQLSVEDGVGGSATQELALTVQSSQNSNQPPVITSAPPSPAVVGIEWVYPVLVVDPDDAGTVLTLQQSPQGMTLGADDVLRWQPQLEQVGGHLVTIKASDGKAWVTQTFTLPVVESDEQNQPPEIVSAPVVTVAPESTYHYPLVVNDPDGDRLTFSLLQAPVGMVVDAQGDILWGAPAYEGEHDVSIQVSDGHALDTQSFTLSVVAEGNRGPRILSLPDTEATGQYDYTYQVVAVDADEDPLTFSLNLAPAGMTITATGLINWLPGFDQVGDHEVQIAVTDGDKTAIQTYLLHVYEEPLPLSVNVFPSSETVDLGDSVDVYVDVSGGVGNVALALSEDGEPVMLDTFGRATLVANEAGRHDLLATATDDQATVSDAAFYSVRVADDTTPPVVELLGPQDLAVIEAPTDILATVQDDNLASWSLFLSPKGQGAWQPIAEGQTELDAAVAGRFDPSMLTNGQFDLLLQARDVNGRMGSDAITLVVEGDLKVGNFSITLEDLNIPMSGIPIRVTRTYDSRRRFEGLDFSHGWSVGYQDVKIEESREPGLYWEMNQYKRGPYNLILDMCVEPQGAPVVTITLPDGDVERFEVKANPECNTYAVMNDVTLKFEPVGDTQSDLAVLGDDTAYFNGNHLVEKGYFSSPVNPNRYKLTTRTGYIYYLDQYKGIEKVITPNGHTLTYTNDGIFHSNGKSVRFTRDSQGRITAITDPKGNVLEYDYDRQGDLRASRDALGNETRYSYNRSHGLLDIEDPLGRSIVRNIYNDSGRLIAQEDSDGNRTDFNHDIEGRQSVVTDRRGNPTFLYYDESGNVTSRVDALGNETSYSYDARGNQLTQTDPLGNVTTATFNNSNDQLTQTDALGNTTAYTYNPRGQELTITDARGNVYKNSYDTVGNLLAVTDPDGNVAGNNIDIDGNVTKTTDMLGNTTEYTYDSDGNKLTETDAVGNTTTFTYDANGNVLTETVSRQVNGQTLTETTRYDYDAADRVVATHYPDGSTVRTEYDAVGNEVAMIDTQGRRTEKVYDAYGRVTAIHYPDATVERKAYDAEGNLVRETDRLGRVSTYTYDALNRQVGITNPDGSTSQTEYDAAGRVVAEINERGERTEYEYDAAGRRTAVIDALGNRHTFEYDADGNRIREIDANGHVTEYEYNDLGQKVLTRFDDGHTLIDEVDVMGRRTAQVDQAGTRTEYGYDGLGRLTEVRQFLDGETLTTSYTYDSQGNKLTQTDAEGRTTLWTYDNMGRVLTRTLPMGQVETFAYGANGNLIRHTDFKGQVTTSDYDSQNRLIRQTYADGTEESWVYDSASQNVEAQQVVDGNVSVTRYDYDDRGRLVRETKPNGAVLEYGYDAAGNRTRLTTTQANGDSRTVTYTFDALNRLSTVSDDTGTTTYGYDAAGNRASLTRPNGVQTTYTYDGVNRLTKQIIKDQAGNILASYTYSLSPTGRRTGIEEHNGRVTEYSHDGLYRLIGETVTDPVNPDYTATFEYDKVGNRTYSTIDGVQTSYAYDDNDRLTQQGGTIYTYDANGNTLTETEDGQITTYTYDARNKLASREDASVLARYGYDIYGIRNSKTENGVTTNYVVDHNRPYAQVLAESSNGAASKQYTYGDDLLSQQAANDSHFYLYDGLGSTRALTDSSGAVTDSYDYEAFGELLNRMGETDNSYLYTGEQYDPNMGQYYLRARYYNQEVGRFTQMDDFAGFSVSPITLNKYAYANADSANGVDPSGYLTLAGLNISMGQLSSGRGMAIRLFVQGQRRAGGRLMSKIGKQAEREVKKIVEECIRPKSLRANPRIKGSRRQLDLLAEAEDVFLNIEVKNKFPRYGSSALRRLKEQLLDAQKSGMKVQVVGGEKVSNKILDDSIEYLKRGGVDMAGVDVFNGLISFARWGAEVYFEECIEDLL